MNESAPRKRQILIVDDEATIVFAMRRFFEARGFETHSATGLEVARDLLSRFRFCVAIIDLRLGGRGDTQGLEVIELAKTRNPETKTILLTAYGSPALDEEARRRGTDAVARKPLPLPDLAEVVSELLRSREGQPTARTPPSDRT